MQDAHVAAVLILGEALASTNPFDFGAQNITARIQRLIPVMLEHRLTPPPPETYSIHRKLSGTFLLCARLRSIIYCKPLFDRFYAKFMTENNKNDKINEFNLRLKINFRFFKENFAIGRFDGFGRKS